MELTGESLITNAATDGLVSRQTLEAHVGVVHGETGRPDDPLANPLHADYTGFPRLYISASAGETLLAMTRPGSPTGPRRRAPM